MNNGYDNINVLFLDAEQTEQSALSVINKSKSYNLLRSSTMAQTAELLTIKEIHVAVVFLNDNMPSSTEITEQIRNQSPFTEIITITNDASMASDNTEQGLFDCLTTPISQEKLNSRIQKAFEHRTYKYERSFLRQQVAMQYSFDNIIGISKKIITLKETIKGVAPTDIPILITGSSGTGKELISRVIHHHSHHNDQRLVVVDCSAIPVELLDMQLFGSEDNTESITIEPCLLEQAHKGTLLLKNIDALPLIVQEKLISFFKNFSINTETEIKKLDIRFISTTSKNLEELISANEFHRDLLDRIGTIVLNIPDLSKRAEDIEILIEYFLMKISTENNRKPVSISRTAIDLLLQHDWPGNIRELENTLCRAAALCNNNFLEAGNIVFIGYNQKINRLSNRIAESKPVARLDESQKSLIQNALVENNWNYTQTAQGLGIGRTTLWRKVKKYNLKPETSVK